MKCPKCGRRIPDHSDSCLNWGAWIKGEASSQARTESSIISVSLEAMEEKITGNQVNQEETNYKKLGGLPLSIKARVEEILKKGEGQSEEIRTSFRNISETKERAGRKRKKMGSLDALKFLLKEE